MKASVPGKSQTTQDYPTETLAQNSKSAITNGTLSLIFFPLSLGLTDIRRILYFPWGNNQKECSSAYIEAIPPPDAPADWYVCAQFAICMWNPTAPTKYRFLSASHRFYSSETDWGFTQFLNIRTSFSRSAHNNETPISRGGQ